MAHIITFPGDSGPRYISCVSVTPPAKIAFSSSERSVDAVKLPYMVAHGIRDMLNTCWSLECALERAEASRG